jgi:hypothetical protein
MLRGIARPSPALLVAIIALFAALTGSSYAEPLRSQMSGLIGGKSIKKRSIGGKHAKKNAFTGFHVKESRLAKVPAAANADQAADADKLDGRDSAEFADGNVTMLAGRTTGQGGADPNPIRTFDTPVGRFELNCGVANADTRYRNTTGTNQEVYRVSTFDADPSLTFLDSAPGSDIGFAATAGLSPAMIELSAASGTTHARLRAHARRSGTTCTWNWELLISR